MKKLKIQILGPCGSGKTTVAKSIASLLKARGAKVGLKDQEDNRDTAIKIDYSQFNVEIETVQTLRSAIAPNRHWDVVPKMNRISDEIYVDD